MKKILLAIIVVIGLVGCGSSTQNMADENKLKIGTIYSEAYMNGEKHEIYLDYKNKLQDGELKVISNNNIVATENYYLGFYKGEYSNEAMTKALEHIKVFEKNHKHSNNVVYSFFQNGQIRTATPYKNNQMHGVTYIYYDNGQVERTTTFKKGIMQGVSKVYYPDGRLALEIKYKKGQEVDTKRF